MVKKNNKKSENLKLDESNENTYEEDSSVAFGESQSSIYDEKCETSQDMSKSSLFDKDSSSISKGSKIVDEEISLSSKTKEQNLEYLKQLTTPEEDKESSFNASDSDAQNTINIVNPITLINDQNSERIVKTYHDNYERSSLFKQVQQVPLTEIDENITYCPEIFTFQELSSNFKIKKSDYDRL